MFSSHRTQAQRKLLDWDLQNTAREWNKEKATFMTGLKLIHIQLSHSNSNCFGSMMSEVLGPNFILED